MTLGGETDFERVGARVRPVTALLVVASVTNCSTVLPRKRQTSIDEAMITRSSD
ncbi:MAG: hypothetical protein ACSLFF_02160 [Solirubrobacterales bacterium]